jgi:low temperature requirement protein LtrA
MVIGIVLVALAMKKTIAHVGHELGTIPAVGLCAGCALYFATYSAMRLRIQGRLSRGRLITAIILLLFFPVAKTVPGIVALAFVAAVLIALHAYELIHWREERAQTRALRPTAAA